MTIASARLARLTETAPKPQDAPATVEDLTNLFTGLGETFERFIAGDHPAQVRAGGFQASMVRELYPYDAAAIVDVFLDRLLHRVNAGKRHQRYLKRSIRVLSWQARGSRYYEPYLLINQARQRFDHQADRFAAILGRIDPSFRVDVTASGAKQYLATTRARDAALDIMALCYLPQDITAEQIDQIPRHITAKQSRDILRTLDRLCKPLL